MKINCYLTNKFMKDFIEDNLNGWQRNFVANHLRNCPKCMERYFKMTKILKAKEERKKREKFFEEVSAQIDFEKLKNKTVPMEILNYNNSQFEAEYEKLITFVNFLEHNLEKSKNSVQIDVVDKIMENIS